MGFVGSMQVGRGDCAALCDPSTQSHTLLLGFHVVRCASLSPPSLDLHQDLGTCQESPNPCSATEQAAVIELPVPGDSFWQCLLPQMGLFWQAEGWP